MINKLLKNKTLVLYVSLFFIAFTTLLIASHSSFLYPTNTWVDANCFMTVAKSMLNGKVLYRDIYDQKGPYLFFIHILCYVISPNKFYGVFFLEILCSFISLIFIVKILKLYGVNSVKKQIFACLFYSLTVYFSIAFAQGDSVEELANPLLLATIYLTLKNKNKPLIYFLVGLFAGFIFWIKFSLVGFFIGFYVFRLVYIFKEKTYKEIAYSIPLILLGVLITSIAPIVYFAKYGEIPLLFKAYILDNFSYGSGQNFFVKILLSILYFLITIVCNPQYNFLTIIAVVVFYKLKDRFNKEKLFVLITFFTTAFFIYIGCRNYRYYGLPLNVFSVFFYVLLYLGEIKVKKEKLFIKLSSVLLVISCIVAMGVGTHFAFIFQPKKSLPQYKIAQEINKSPNPTLLNYGFLDGGFYLASNIEPSSKYFCTLNNELQEMIDEHNNILTNGLVEYVVIRSDKVSRQQFENKFTKYEFVTSVTQKYLFFDMYDYILFKLK